MRPFFPFVTLAALLLFTPASVGAQESHTLNVDDLDLSSVTRGYGEVERNLSVGGAPMTLGGKA